VTTITPAGVFNGSLKEPFGCRVNLHILFSMPSTNGIKDRGKVKFYIFALEKRA
jgi:hypothetical protein